MREAFMPFSKEHVRDKVQTLVGIGYTLEKTLDAVRTHCRPIDQYIPEAWESSGCSEWESIVRDAFSRNQTTQIAPQAEAPADEYYGDGPYDPVKDTSGYRSLFEFWDSRFADEWPSSEAEMHEAAHKSYCPYTKSKDWGYQGCEDIPNAAREWLRSKGREASTSPLKDDIGSIMSAQEPPASETRIEQPVRTNQLSGNGLKAYVDYETKRVSWYIENHRDRPAECEVLFKWTGASGNGNRIHETPDSEVRRISVPAGKRYRYSRDFSPGFWIQPNSADYSIKCSE